MKIRSENFLKNNFHRESKTVIKNLNKEIQQKCHIKNCNPPKELNFYTLEKFSLKFRLPINKILSLNIEETIKEIKSLVKDRVRKNKEEHSQENNVFISKCNHYSLRNKEQDLVQNVIYEVQTFKENLKIRFVPVLERTETQNESLLNIKKKTSNSIIQNPNRVTPPLFSGMQQSKYNPTPIYLTNEVNHSFFDFSFN